MTKPHYRAGESGPQLVHDGLQNLVSGLGTRSDKRAHNSFAYSNSFYDFTQFEAAYMDNWIARQIVNVPVDDGLREWREWQCEDSEAISKEEQRLKLAYHYKLARYWSRLYGGSVIVMLTDQPLDQPLRIESVKKGGLKRLVVLDRWEISPQIVNYVDPIAENYLLPEYYTIRGGTSSWIHSSHLVRVDGEELPRRLRAYNQTWGDSTLRKVLEDLKDVAGTKAAIATLVQESNVDVITREGLSQELASGEESAIMTRYALAAQMKSFVNQLLLDGSETYERKQLAFSGLGEIMDKFMIWISGAAEIPMTRLFGRSAAGMNATGEGDMNNYYDAVASMQENQFRPDLEKLDEVMVRSALGGIPEDCEWEWMPLYQEDGNELAQQELASAQSEDMRLTQGVIRRSHVMQRLKQEGRYAIAEEDIERAQRDEKAELNGEFDPRPDDPEPFGATEGDEPGGPPEDA